MHNNKPLDLPVREIISHTQFDNMLAYISVTAFISMGATLLLILSL